jgi:hypothetical protein
VSTIHPTLKELTMNPWTPSLWTALLLVSAATATVAQQPTIEDGPVNPPAAAADTRASPSAGASARLRCWQHGVIVIDEPLAPSAMPTAPTHLLSTQAADGSRLLVVGHTAVLCLARSHSIPVPRGEQER